MDMHNIYQEWLEHQRSIRFEITIPQTYNPQEQGASRPMISPELIAEIRSVIHCRFKASRTLRGDGTSTDPHNNHISEEPELYIHVNVAAEEAMAVFDWFAQYCPQWARLLDQWAIYLELPFLGLTYFFPPDYESRTAYPNPFRAMPLEVMAGDAIAGDFLQPVHKTTLTQA